MTTILATYEDNHIARFEITELQPHGHTVYCKFNTGDFYTKVSIDGNSNMIVEYKHAGGQGRFTIPSGLCFTIHEAMEVLQASGERLLDKETTYYKEVK